MGRAHHETNDKSYMVCSCIKPRKDTLAIRDNAIMHTYTYISNVYNKIIIVYTWYTPPYCVMYSHRFRSNRSRHIKNIQILMLYQ